MLIVTIFFTVVIFFTTLISANVLCDFTPIQIPIQDINLTGNTKARGIAITVGTPGKQYAFMPDLALNNTWMYEQAATLCAKLGDLQFCTAYRGGLFTGPSSSTFTGTSDVVSAGGVSGDNDTATFQVGAAQGGSDTLDLGKNTTIPRFPLGFPRKDWGGGVFPMNSLGLGLNSTLLSALKAAGKIGSRSFSVYYGLPSGTGTTNQDGSLILGGYDAAKVSGKKFQKALGPRTVACPTGMIITANDIQLNFPGGKNATITPAATIDFCIVPSFPGVMSLPLDPFFNTFESLTGTKRTGLSTGINFGSALYTADTAFKGNITLTLSPDLSLTIPTTQLLIPEQTLDPNGITQSSPTISSLLISPIGKNNAQPIMLGRNFLSSAYLSINQDEYTFSLWSANPNPNIPSQIVPIKDFSCFTPTTAANTTLPTDHAHVDDHHNTSSPTAMAAIIVSTLLLISIAISTLFMCMRSKKQKAHEAEEAKRMSFMDRGIEGDASEIPGGAIRDIGLAESETVEETKYEMWAGETNVFEMSAPVASWTPLGQQRASALPHVDGVGGWPLGEKAGRVAELPAG